MADRNIISILIKLLGGDAMIAELEKLGDTGEAAIDGIEQAANRASLAGLGGAVSNLLGDMKTMGERIALGIAGATAVASAAAPVIFAMAKSGAEAADQAEKAAQAAGLQTKAYQELSFAADQAGVHQEGFDAALSSFNKEIAATANNVDKAARKAGGGVNAMGRNIRQGAGFTVEAFDDIGVSVTRFGDKVAKTKKGASDSQTAFQKLGLSVKTTDGSLKSTETLLGEVADAFKKMPDGARKSALAIELFGKSGVKLIPFLNQGRDGIASIREEAERLGIIFTDDQIKSAQAFNDSLDAMRKTIASVLRQIGLLFAPTFTAGARSFTEIIRRNRRAILDFVDGAIRAGTQLVRDFFAVLSGRDADVLDNKWLIDWRDAILQFGDDFVHVANGVVLPAMKLLRSTAKLVTDAINALFGTDLTAGQVLILASLTQIIGGFRVLRSAIMLAIEGIALFSRALLTNPWIAVLTAVAGGIALWATRIDEGTSALRSQRKAVEDVDRAYDAVGRKVENLTQKQKEAALVALTVSQDQTRKALNDELESLRAYLAERIKAVDEAVKEAGDRPLHDTIKKFLAFEGPLKDFVNGGSIDKLGEQINHIGASNTELAQTATTFQSLIGKGSDLSKSFQDNANHIALYTGSITDAEFATRQAALGVEGYADAIKPAGKNAADAATDIKAAGDAAGQTADKVEAAGRRIRVTKFGPDGKSVQEFDTLANGAARAVDRVTGKFDDLGQTANRQLSATGQQFGQVKSLAKDAAGAVDNAGKDTGEAADAIAHSLDGIAPAAQQAVTEVQTALGSIDSGQAAIAAAAILAPFQDLPGQMQAVLSAAQTLLSGGFGSLKGEVASLAASIRDQITQIIAQLRQAIETARAMRQAASSGTLGGNNAPGLAGGGSVRGPGTSTSDSILAWLSDGEYVIRAAAVQKFGKGFFDMLNGGVLPSLKALRGYNFGGIVEGLRGSLDIAIPRYASGGSVERLALSPASSGSAGMLQPLHLHLPNGDDIMGMFKPMDVASKLGRYATSSASNSTGRKPGWYK